MIGRLKDKMETSVITNKPLFCKGQKIKSSFDFGYIVE